MINKLILSVYVNNLLIAGEHKANIIYIKQFFKAKFKLKDLKEI